MDLKSWLKHILEGMVFEPSLITIEEKTDEMGILFTVSTTSNRDTGILIGQKFEHVNALRIILRTAGYSIGVKASLKITTICSH